MERKRKAPLSYREAEERKIKIQLKIALVIEIIALIFSIIALIFG